MHVHKRLEVAHCLVTHYFRLLLLWSLSNDLVLNPIIGIFLVRAAQLENGWARHLHTKRQRSGNAADVNHSKAVAFRYRRGSTSSCT